MMPASVKPLTLEEFLKLPDIEESPAWEYINGNAIQKPMPKTRYSLLQKRLLAVIDSNTEDYTALPELRCTFGGRSVVPDVAVVAWNRMPMDEEGEPQDNFLEPPDWTIEILSPEQKANQVIDNILHCLRHGCQLGWLIDPDDHSILTFKPKQEPEVYRASARLQVLESTKLKLTAEQVFGWLKIVNR
ncbi:Uma2 family endonuclease [Microcoleus sp. ZQ-A2]|nr:Uma2 family endonuclease [Microcoleus sp. FACHB-1]